MLHGLYNGGLHMTRRLRNRAKGFTHGGPRKGVMYEVARLDAMVPEIREFTQAIPLCIVAVRMLTSPRNLYFRVRRHKIPYLIGPKDSRPGFQVWLPLASIEQLVPLMFRRQRTLPASTRGRPLG